MNPPHRILFVCTGNICRSPTAEAVMRTLVRKASLEGRIEIDSAGTHPCQAGFPPDPRAQQAARRRGYDLSLLRARQVTLQDFEGFDMILGMDFANLEWLQSMCPAEHRSKVGLLMPYATGRHVLVVHDPYHRSAKEFETALDYIEDGCAGLLRVLASQLSGSAVEAGHPWAKPLRHAASAGRPFGS